MKNFAGMSTLDVWYAGNDAIRKRRRTYVDGIGRRTIRNAYDDMTEAAGASRRFVDEPPLVYHWSGHDAEFFDVDAIFAAYRQSMGWSTGWSKSWASEASARAAPQRFPCR